MVYHLMSDDDVDRIMQHPHVGDRVRQLASSPSVEGVPHPRGYGNNARVLGEYVRTRHVISARRGDPEDDVAAGGAVPASPAAGSIRAGYAADLVVFDPATVGDRATFEKPHAYAAGIPYVIVNGVMVVEKGVQTAARPGVVLTGAPPAGRP